jgi:hypothetical protein
LATDRLAKGFEGAGARPCDPDLIEGAIDLM